MELATAKALARSGKRLGIEARLYREYSGRGMYGKTTAALVIPHAGTLAALAAGLRIRRERRAEIAHELGDLRQDSMGRDIVVY